MQPACCLACDPLAQGRDQGRHRHAGGHRPGGKRERIYPRVRQHRGNGLGVLRRHDPEPALNDGERPFEDNHVSDVAVGAKEPDEILIREQA